MTPHGVFRRLRRHPLFSSSHSHPDEDLPISTPGLSGWKASSSCAIIGHTKLCVEERIDALDLALVYRLLRQLASEPRGFHQLTWSSGGEGR